MRQYLDLLADIIQNGTRKPNRTGTDTLSVFGRQLRFDLSKGFPLLTTKKVYLRAIIHELLWMLRGDTNVKYLRDNKVTIWDEWADENGELGPVYGYQWRHWNTEGGKFVDQIADVIARIKKDPNDRRLIVSAWNVADVPKMRLPPCHMMFQFYVANGKLSCQMYQRSADVFLGVPFNIASYALLTMMIAKATGLMPGEFIHTFGDVHLYVNHLEQAKTQLAREPKSLPTMKIAEDLPAGEAGVRGIDGFVFDDFKLTDYNPHPAIKAEVAV